MLRNFLALALLLCCGAVSAAAFEKALMPGQVIRDHAKYEDECSKCHELFDKAAQTRLCLDCHKDIAQDVKAKQGLHGHLDNHNCKQCHTEHKGRQARIAPLDKEKFDHATTGYKLKHAHAAPKVKCDSCHLPKKKFREVGRVCNDCHRKDDEHKGHLGTKCDKCHNEKDWKETTFDHEKTRFPLQGGKHADVKCKECHRDRTYQDTPTKCHGCHRKDDNEKGHKGNFGNKCETCHSDQGWKEIRFNHDRDTRYDLKGKHRQVKCTSCHLPEKGLLYQQKLSSKCIACHRKDDNEKGHKGGLGEKCESCHNERSWQTTDFDHDKTEFPLRDKHKDVKCAACHVGGVSGPKARLKLEKTCFACHQKDDQKKAHKGRYGNKCESCHTEKDWKKTKFDHDRDTKYLLKGKHAQTKCDACHLPAKGNIYQHKLDSYCFACHKSDDKHKGQLGNKCDDCHNEQKWTGVVYDHNKSRFPLTGSHRTTPCKKCHLTPAFKDASMLCNDCHQKDDKHKGRFGKKCESCHYTTTWKSWDFDHDKTRFPLDGAHKKVECYDCHKTALDGPDKPGRACVACHLKDDVHDGGFGGQCERCHVTSDWKKIRR